MTPALPILMLAVAFAALGVVFGRAPGNMDPKLGKTAGWLFLGAALLCIVAGIGYMVRG